jgi:tetratricopeptide (TPR) repeat protein
MNKLDLKTFLSKIKQTKRLRDEVRQWEKSYKARSPVKKNLIQKILDQLKSSDLEGESSIQDSYYSIFSFWLTRIIDWYLLFLIFIIPLYFLPVTVSPVFVQKNLFFEISVGILALLILVHFMANGQIAYPKSHLRTAYFTAIAAYIISFAVSPNKIEGLKSYVSSSNIISIVCIFVFFLILTTRFNDFKKLFKIIKILLASGFCLSIFSLLQFAHIYLLPWSFTKNESFNPIGSVNAYAIIIACYSILAAISFVFIKDLKIKIFSLATFFSTLLTIFIIAYSKAWQLVLLSSLFTLGIYFYRILINNSAWEKTKRIVFKTNASLLVFILIIIVGCFSLFKIYTKEPIVDAPEGSFLNPKLLLDVVPSSEKTLSIIFDVWRDSVWNLFFGTGPGTFIQSYNLYRGQDLSDTIFWNSSFAQGSSFYLTLVAETGLIGLLAFTFLLIIVLFYFIKGTSICCKRQDLTGDEFGLYLISLNLLLISTLSLFIYKGNLVSIFIFGVASAVNVTIYTLTTGHESLSKYRYLVLVGSNQWSTFTSIITFIAIIGVVVFLWFDSKRLIAFAYFSESINQYSISDVRQSYNNLVQSLKINNEDPLILEKAAQVCLARVQKLDLMNNPDKQSEAEGYYNEAITYAKRATELAPGEADPWYFLGSVYESSLNFLNNDSADTAFQYAYDSYQKAIERDPDNPERRVNLIRLAISYTDILEIRINLEKQSGDVLNSKSDVYKKVANWYTGRQNTLLMGYKTALEAIKLKNNYIIAYYYLAQVSERLVKYQEATDAINKALILDPQNENYLFLKGFIQYKNSDYTGAEKSLLDALGLNPNHAEANYLLALTYQAQNRTDEAKAQFDKFKTVQPKSNLPSMSEIKSIQLKSSPN